MRRVILFILISCVVFACQSPEKKKTKTQQSTFKGSYKSNAKAIVSIRTFDHYTRRIKDGYGFYVAPDIVVTNLSLVKGAYKAKCSPMDLEDFSSAAGYLAYDINLDLVLLKVNRRNKQYLDLKNTTAFSDSLYKLFRKDRKLYAKEDQFLELIKNDSISYLNFAGKVKNGKPYFAKSHHLVGIIQANQKQGRLLHAKWIKQLMASRSKDAHDLYNLRTKTNKVYISHTRVQGFRIITNKGNIEIQLSDKTPKYRDNFIKLVSDNFYDSLLVHRVIKDFLIQTGAVDSKYAKKDDVVGWKGPGYMLPMNIVPGLFHKRGMVAASKLPADRNKYNRSDGSQFYIIAGRIFSDTELDELEKEKNIKYTGEQRQAYTTIGGAPYLDGDYTVFGWVSKGMDVVDKMASQATYAIDRPIDEIRIRTVEIIKK